MMATTHRCAVCLVWLGLASTACAQANLDGPRGGWRNSSGDPTQHVQSVQYPANNVNSGAPRYSADGQRIDAAIRGRIAQAPKAAASGPHLLVVNGVAMPLRTDADGSFARPYAFGPGSNSVEIRSNDRQWRRRVQYVDSNALRQRVGLRVLLSWDTDMTDLDLHVVAPDGEHVFYGHRMGHDGGALDVDVTTGYGPEIYANPAPQPGLWQVYVNYFGGGNEATSVITTAQITVVLNEGTLDERRELVRVPMRRPGELTLARTFRVP